MPMTMKVCLDRTLSVEEGYLIPVLLKASCPLQSSLKELLQLESQSKADKSRPEKDPTTSCFSFLASAAVIDIIEFFGWRLKRERKKESEQERKK